MVVYVLVLMVEVWILVLVYVYIDMCVYVYMCLGWWLEVIGLYDLGSWWVGVVMGEVDVGMFFFEMIWSSMISSGYCS